MKIFLVQIRNANHPTGKYRRDGMIFQIGRKVYAEEISKVIATDKNLKVSEVEQAKDMEVLKKIGTAPYTKAAAQPPSAEENKEK